MTPPPPGAAIKLAGERTVAVLLDAADAIRASLSREEVTLAPSQTNYQIITPKAEKERELGSIQTRRK